MSREKASPRGGEPVTAGDVIKFVRGRRYRPMTAHDVADHFGVAHDDRPEFVELVRRLEREGELVEVKLGCLAAPDKVGLVVGKLQCHARGFGFVVPARERDGEDIYVHAEVVGQAMHGDIVAVQSPNPRRGGGRGRRDRGPAGRVARVVERVRKTLVGTFRRDRGVAYVEPVDARFFRDVYVPSRHFGGARDGEKVVVEITAPPRRGLNPEGVVRKVLGDAADPRVQAMAVIEEFDLREAFPDEALREAEAAPRRVRPSDLEGRLDLRETVTFTIDPEDAKDFDDAVSIRREGDGWALGVHIADVAHYAPLDCAIDREARERGTSVYLPGRVLPMLPEALSENICSLREDRVRLTRSVLMRFDREGRRLDARIARSVIRSRRRLTYEQVLAFFEGREAIGGEVGEALTETRELARVLRRMRLDRGMLEIDLPETRVRVDEAGAPERVELRYPDESHRLIEHFMLSANEAVAEALADAGLPCIARRHDEPDYDSMATLRKELKALGYSLGVPGTRRQLQDVIGQAKDTEEAYAVNVTVLRSMRRAEYSAAKWGHYAIAAGHYTHFTSPIRRYPDLLVHRLLTEWEDGLLADERRLDAWRAHLATWLAAASDAERRAEAAERDLTRRLTIDIMRRDPDAVFDALVTNVDDRGAFVAILDLGIEGRLPFHNLRNDFYRVDRRRGRLVGRGGGQIRVGRTIRVRVDEADPDRGALQFAPADAPKRPRGRG